MLRYISNSVVTFLKGGGQAGVAEEVFSKALRIYDHADPRFAALSQLVFAMVNNDRLVVGFSPWCPFCGKELDWMDLPGIPASLKSATLALFEGVVCTACRKVEC